MTLAFRPTIAIETLARHRIEFILIGGIGGRLHGSPTVTNDLDICYARSDENFIKLVAALRELNARVRGVVDDVPFVLDDKTLRAGDHFTFLTDAGAFDCLGTPAGTSGYDDLVRTAVEMDLGGFRVRVASIDDLIRMKLASGRPKDRIEVEVLGALRDTIEEAPD